MKQPHPKRKSSRRVTLTLTPGEEKAILESMVYRLTGTIPGALRFWIRKGIEESMSSKPNAKVEPEPDFDAIR